MSRSAGSARRSGSAPKPPRSRVRRAGPFLRNVEDRRGQPARYVVGEAMPAAADADILPTVEELERALEEDAKWQETPRGHHRGDRPSQNPVTTGDLGSVTPNDPGA